MLTKILLQHPEFQEIIEEVITKSQQLLRPPEQVIIDDLDLQKILKCSKRKTAEMREERLITYYKPSGKIFYKLSDVYAFLEKNKVPAIGDKLKL